MSSINAIKMNKKIIIAITIVAVLIIIGVAAFLIMRRGEKIEKGGIFSLFPGTEDKQGYLPPTEGPADVNEGKITQPERFLIQLTNTPISAATFDNKTNKIKYIDRLTGHLYEISPDGNETKQLTITTIPGIYEVSWSKDLSRALLRYYSEDTTSGLSFLASFPATSTSQSTGQTEGIFLPTSVNQALFSPTEENKIFYLLNSDGKTTGIIANTDNQSKKEIFSSSFTNFMANWPQKNIITLITKPSASASGFLYSLHPTNQTFTKILSAIQGLTVLYSPMGDEILYSKSENNSIETRIYNTKKETDVKLGVTTLPEKCLFSKLNTNTIYCAVPRPITSALYPDEWYQGKVSFSDSIWQINTVDGSTKSISSQQNFDATNLFSDSNENYIFFTNKKNNTLWALKIKN